MKLFTQKTAPFLLGLLVGITGSLPVAAQQAPPQELSAAEVEDMKNLGSLVGTQAGQDAAASGVEHQEGPTEHSGGRVRIAGQWYDTDKITGGRDDSDKVDRAGLVEADGNMDDLRDLHDEAEAEIVAENESTARSTAYKSTHDSDDRWDEGKLLVEETNWDTTQQAFEEAVQGKIGEDTAPSCETTRTVIPGTKEVSVTDQEVCEKVFLAAGDENGVACTRERVCDERQDDVNGERVASLVVSQDISAQACSRESSVETYNDDLSQSTSATLDITEEVDGLSCRRSVYPETTDITTPSSHDLSLNIDTQVQPQNCTREIWPTDSTQYLPNQLDTTVSVNNESGGQVCTRTRTATGGGTTSVSHFADYPVNMVGGMGCFDTYFIPLDLATAQNVNIWVQSQHAQYSADLISWMNSGMGTTIVQVHVERIGHGVEYCEIVGVDTAYVRVFWSFDQPQGVSFGLTETGDCSATGSPNCPAQWTCTGNAPTTIGGVPVTAEQVQSLSALFPGAPATCTAATKSLVCSGSPAISNNVSIAHLIPPGTTSLDNFALTVLNPQAGVTVAVTQTPSAANSWVAIVQVTRTSWATTPVNPQIRLSWTAVVDGSNITVQDTGNCSGTSTANCTAQWTCTANAPTTINGILVTAAMAQDLAPLFPGAGNNCARASLSGSCSGAAVEDTSVDLTTRLPPGTTTLSSFTFNVLNPQAGVNVTLIQTPTIGNGWVAIYRTSRTIFNVAHAQPLVRMTWDANHQDTTISVRDVGNCSDIGSPACPAVWACESPATFTVNGIPVSGAMAATQAPLFPGAASNCVVGTLSRVCSGSSSLVSEISISAQLPPGTTDITNFNWSWNNPDSSLTVVLLDPPSLGNGWLARFQVTRQYTPGGPEPPRPNVTLTWNVESEDLYRVVVDEQGDCSAAAEGGFCPLQWQCNATGPGMHDGHNVTVAMLEERGPLFPDDTPPRCLEAELSNTCTGDGSALTQVDLSPDIPDYVEEIRDYEWVVSTPSAGVNVSQVQVPTKENGWKAIFRTDRTNWATMPSPPEVTLTWVRSGETYYECEIVETGDCNVTSDEFCDASWTCTRDVEDPDAETPPVLLSSVSTSPIYFGLAFPGSPHSASVTLPAGLIPAGTVRMDNFSWTISSRTGSGLCQANVSGNPTPGNPHTHVTVINGTGHTGGGGGGGGYWHEYANMQIVFHAPQIHFTERVAQQMLDAIFPSAFASPTGCGVNIVFSWDNIGHAIPPPATGSGPFASDLVGEPELFPGDGGTCMQAELGVSCQAIWVGEECYTNSDGDEVCVDQPPSDTPNTCGELEAADNCTLVREECTEGGMSTGGWCYVRSYLYDCTRTFEVPNPTITEETVCTDGTAGIPSVCMDGSCMDDTPDVTTGDVLEPAARMMIIQHQMKDYKRITSSPLPPGGGGGPGDPQVPVINP